MKTYTHTQIGYVMLAVMFTTILFLIWLSATLPPEGDFIFNIIMFLVVAISLSFSTLQTSVDDNYLRIKFGFGIFKKRFPLDNIASVRVVKNRWYYGWGIRVWFWPYMWIYNVSGFDAVELVMKNGKIYRVGTDTPQELEVEINNRM